ncbi:MAG: hypothetical protein P8Y97_21970 [Candidatus Lokiarchaeota archaeon]
MDQFSMKAGYLFAEKTIESFKGDATKSEILLTKSLGVLQEQGIYAFILFCKSRPEAERESGNKIIEITEELLKADLELILNNDDILKEIRDNLASSSNLNKLILANRLLEKSLIYGRYHAKARKNENK